AEIGLRLLCRTGRGDQIGFVLPKLSASADIALQHRLSDRVAPQQTDEPAMVVKWDALLLAAVVAGGSMLIENSHRLDTGAPDEEVVAISTCSDTLAGDRDAWKPLTLPTGDES